MDPLTSKARELVAVELKGTGFWNGLAFDAPDLAHAQKLERGRAEILVAQSRARLSEFGRRVELEIVDVAQPAPRTTAGEHDVARQLKAAFPEAVITMTRVHHRRENH